MIEADGLSRGFGTIQGPKIRLWSVMLAFAEMNQKCSLIPIGYHPGVWSGEPLSEAEAIAIVDEAAETPAIWNCDKLAKYLGLTYQQRTQLEIKTIGACDFSRRHRRRQRRHKDRMYQLHKRRATGARPHSQSISATEPWRELGMSRATWYRKNRPGMRRETDSSAISSVSPDDGSVPLEGVKKMRPSAAPPKAASRGLPREASPPRKQEGLTSSRTATKLAADVPVSDREEAA